MKDFNIAVFWLACAVFTAVAALTALAINHYCQEESTRLDRVHSAGMALGNSLCKGGGQ